LSIAGAGSALNADAGGALDVASGGNSGESQLRLWLVHFAAEKLWCISLGRSIHIQRVGLGGGVCMGKETFIIILN
jgi:hypothetical protein